MQTFLPYEDYRETAACLDMRRLGKQRVEAKQILLALGVPVGGHFATLRNGWRSHPAVLMWAGYEESLMEYAIAICEEWIGRGYRDSLLCQFEERLSAVTWDYKKPWWLGWQAFHASHRSNLLRKDRSFYEVNGWDEPDSMDYVWPV